MSACAGGPLIERESGGVGHVGGFSGWGFHINRPIKRLAMENPSNPSNVSKLFAGSAWSIRELSAKSILTLGAYGGGVKA
jgi:hypothetical protein